MRAHAGLKGAGAFPGSVDPSLSVGLGASISDTEPVRGVGASPGDDITNLYQTLRPEGENCAVSPRLSSVIVDSLSVFAPLYAITTSLSSVLVDSHSMFAKFNVYFSKGLSQTWHLQ